MTVEAHAANGIALPVEILTQPAHFLGRARESVRHQAAGAGILSLTGKEERFCSWDGLRHIQIISLGGIIHPGRLQFGDLLVHRAILIMRTRQVTAADEEFLYDFPAGEDKGFFEQASSIPPG